jgi:pyrrolidone-carboxylate peptidase
MAAADAAVTEIFECVPEDSSHVIIVHLGVAAAAKSFHLEEQAANDCNFRCPDESGAQPRGQCICDAFALESFLSTALPLRAIAARLHERWHRHVEISCDAGRFLCNYIYYRSLLRATPRKHVQSVFIHVPLHTAIDLQQQADFVCDFVRYAADHVLGAASPDVPAQFRALVHESAAVSDSKSGHLQRAEQRGRCQAPSLARAPRHRRRSLGRHQGCCSVKSDGMISKCNHPKCLDMLC